MKLNRQSEQLVKIAHYTIISYVKSWTFTIKQPTNKLNIRILSKTRILYLIRYASVILIMGLHLLRRMPTSEHCWKKKSGAKWA